jgi:hypothetical protein
MPLALSIDQLPACRDFVASEVANGQLNFNETVSAASSLPQKFRFLAQRPLPRDSVQVCVRLLHRKADIWSAAIDDRLPIKDIARALAAMAGSHRYLQKPKR